MPVGFHGTVGRSMHVGIFFQSQVGDLKKQIVDARHEKKR